LPSISFNTVFSSEITQKHCLTAKYVDFMTIYSLNGLLFCFSLRLIHSKSQNIHKCNLHLKLIWEFGRAAKTKLIGGSWPGFASFMGDYLFGFLVIAFFSNYWYFIYRTKQNYRNILYFLYCLLQILRHITTLRH
jgi:hypothetical protein